MPTPPLRIICSGSPSRRRAATARRCGARMSGEVVGAAGTLLWTFVPPSRPRLGAVVSSVVGEKGEFVQELRTLVCCGWRWAGGCRGLCWGCGPSVVDLVLLLAVSDGRGWIWRLKVSSGQVPDPRATAICGRLWFFFSGFTTPIWLWSFFNLGCAWTPSLSLAELAGAGVERRLVPGGAEFSKDFVLILSL